MHVQKEEFNHYRVLFENELKNILDYWIKHAVEKGNNGFYGAVDMNGKPVKDANKSCVLNTRILWTFSAAAKKHQDVQYHQIAKKAAMVVTEHFIDKKQGGFYMELSSDNQVANDVKHTYAQAFGLYALCKYYELSPEAKIIDLIQETYYLLEEKTKDKVNAGYHEAYSRDWEPLVENRMADNNEPKSMNTHLHVVEAYAALYKVWKNEELKRRLHDLLNLFLDKIIRSDGHLGIFFDEKFNETNSSMGICSFGHDIEASWLLWEAAEILDDEDILNRMKPVSILMAEAVEREGLDKDGGLFLESYRYGSHLRTNKHWWLQAENLVGFMNAYELSKDPRYWDIVKLGWSFIDQFVIDHERGEWYTKVNRLGVPFLKEPKEDPSPYYRNDWKIDPWKCPYHNGRAMMEMMNRIEHALNQS